MERPLYINWLVNEDGVTFEDGVALKCYMNGKNRRR